MNNDEQKLIEVIATSPLPECFRQLLYVDMIVQHASRHAQEQLTLPPQESITCLACMSRFTTSAEWLKHKC